MLYLHTQAAFQSILDVAGFINENPGVVPLEYQSTSGIINISNFVLQGVNNTGDPKVEEYGQQVIDYVIDRQGNE